MLATLCVLSLLAAPATAVATPENPFDGDSTDGTSEGGLGDVLDGSEDTSSSDDGDTGDATSDDDSDGETSSDGGTLATPARPVTMLNSIGLDGVK